MRKLAEIVTNHPKLTILLALIIVVVLASGVRKISIKENLKEMLPKDIASRQVLNELEDTFGGSDVLLIAISHDESVFNKHTLGVIKTVTDTLEMMDGITRVSSLSTIKEIKGEEWGLEVIPFMEEVPETEGEIELMRERIFDDSTYIGQFISEDGKFAAVIAIVDGDADNQTLYRKVSGFTGRLEGPEELFLSGIPVILSIVSHNIRSDLRRLIPFVIVVVCVIMFLSFGTFSGMALPLLAALLSTVSMVGLMGHLGKPFMLVNNVMPVILIAIGVSYAIHIIAGYYDELEHGYDRKEAVLITIDHVGTPVMLAGLTTMVGFGSLVSAPLPTIAEFGVFLVFGVLMATLLTTTLVPAILILLPVPRRIMNKVKPGLLDRLLSTVGRTVPKWRRAIFIAGLILIITFAFGLPALELDMNPISFFHKDSPLRKADDTVNDHLGGSININLLFRGNIQSPEVMKAMDDVQRFMETFPETGATFSLANIVKKINRVMNEDNPEAEVVPETEEAIAQALLMYSMSGSPEDFEQFVDNSYETAQVVARMKSVSTKRTAKVAKAVDQYCQDNLSAIEKVETTGMVVFLKDLANLVIIAQVRTLLISILLISIIAWITYRSLTIGILSIIPIVITIVLNFGLMGYLGIALSIPTAMISSIIIGIGIDFSFHFISRFKLELKRNSETEAVINSIKRVGKPILYDALPTACGFLVLLSSEFLPVRYLGFLISLTMMVCAVGALTILAAALTLTKAK